MGIGLGGKCSSSPYAAPNSNPNPGNFTVTMVEYHNTTSGQQVLLLKVNYPDARNFEGDKILVYLGYTTVGQLLKATGNKLDPHFANVRTAPVARFKPDARGLDLARSFVRGLA